MMNLAGKTVIFTGGMGGIGFEACKVLMTKKLAFFAVLDNVENPKAVQTLQAIDPNTKLYVVKFDVTNKDTIKKTVSEIVAQTKYIDVLVNAAGVLADHNMALTINVNLIGLMNLTFECLPYMNKNQQGRGGHIVNISSVFGLEPCPPAIIYGASKFGVMGFSRSLADPYYYEKTGVAVTIFCPGLTDTPLKNNLMGNYTFDYSKEIGEKYNLSKTQTPATCGAHLAQVVEICQNGGIFISNLGTLKAVELKEFWTPTY